MATSLRKTSRSSWKPLSQFEPMLIQDDFGAFDQKFMGITVFFENGADWNTFKSYEQEETPPALDDLGQKERFRWLLRTSVILHETRHFHDFFLSSYSSFVFRLQTQKLASAIQVLPTLLNSEGNCLPVPLQRWRGYDEAKRRDQLNWSGAREDGLAWRPISIPTLQQQPYETPKNGVMPRDKLLVTLLDAGAAADRKINEIAFDQRSDVILQTWQVYELSALLAQAQAIGTEYGAEAISDFVVGLLDTESDYGCVLDVVNRLFLYFDQPLDIALASAMACWCLFGSYDRDGENASPSHRFARLVQLLAEDGLPSERDDCCALFASWSQRLNLSTVAEGVEAAAASYAEFCDRFRTSSQALDFEMREILEPLLRLIEGVASASRSMADAFLKDPHRYVQPYRWANEIDDWIAPYTRYAIASPGLRFQGSQQEIEASGGRIMWTSDQNGVVSLAVLPKVGASPHLPFEDVLEIATLHEIADLLFSEHRRSETMQYAAREFFKDSHLRPLEVFD